MTDLNQQFIREVSLVRENVTSEIDRLGVGHAYGERSLHARSHGEGFLDLVINRLKGNGYTYLTNQKLLFHRKDS